MRIYELDEVDSHLQLMPMAARRALDHAGKKVSLAAWQALPLDSRRELTNLGSELTVDAAAVRRWLEVNGILAEDWPRAEDPAADTVPEEISAVFGLERPIPAATWSALTPLDRYVLVRIASKARPERVAQAYREIVGQSAYSSHLEPGGGVRMVDVGEKPTTRRTAMAETRVTASPQAIERLIRGDGPKGDVFGVARIAAIQAAKKTSDLIPLCHVLALTKVSVEFHVDQAASALRIVVTVRANDRTGVEMEALTAASVAALTVYDMLKSIDRAMVIGPTRLLEKHGGRTGDFVRRDGETLTPAGGGGS